MTMARRSSAQVSPSAHPNGVIFDQHYTDSLIRVALGRRYRSTIPLARSVARRDVLLSLLLFGSAHIVAPFWLTDTALRQLEPLETEGLLRPIPGQSISEAFVTVRALINKCLEIDDFRREVPSLSLNPLTGKVSGGDRIELDRYTRGTELETDFNLLLKRLQYFEPVIQAATRHFKDPSLELPETVDLVDSYTDAGLRVFETLELSQLGLEPEDGLADFLRTSIDVLAAPDEPALVHTVFHNRKDPYHSDFELDDDTAGALAANAKRLRVALLAILTANSCERYAAVSNLPLRTTATAVGRARVDPAASEDAYQLFKIQFEALRYPVLETLDDVRRLRESPHLRSYRAVIAEYSATLRNDVTSGKAATLKQFRHDLNLANGDLKKLGRNMGAFDTISFWISLPLIAVGTYFNIPIDDILLVPATFYARRYEKQKRKELDWILLGRP